MGSGVAAGGGLVLLRWEVDRPADDVVSFAAWIGMTAAVMLDAGLVACVEPARRALRINPIDALRDLNALRLLDSPPPELHDRHNNVMPYPEMPPGALALLILRVLRSGDLHGYAIAQRIHTLSADELRVEEGALYPALQRLLRQGLVKAEWGTSETNRQVRFYTLTPSGRKELDAEMSAYERVHKAIRTVLRTA